MRKLCAIAFVWAFVSHGADAQEQPATIIGIATNDDGCGNWIAARGKKLPKFDAALIEGMTVGWVQGYLSGMNDGSPSVKFDEKPKALSLPAHTTIAAYLDKFCKENPLRPIYMGSLLLANDLYKAQRLK
jgi:hypothetical protein